jgi:hypothetical protein
MHPHRGVEMGVILGLGFEPNQGVFLTSATKAITSSSIEISFLISLDKRLREAFKKCSFNPQFLDIICYWIPSIHIFLFPTCAIVSVSMIPFSGFAAHRIELNSTCRFQHIACFQVPSFVFPSSRISCIMCLAFTKPEFWRIRTKTICSFLDW